MPPAAIPTDPDTWHPARLIPTAGIRGQDEQEKRATSCLLAVMAAVPEFGKALLAEVGAPKGRIATFAEVQLKDADGKLSIPDGVAVVERGGKTWRCIVEVKTSDAPPKPEQVNRYLDMAREHGFDAVVTLSNQITRSPEDCPVDVDKRKTRSTALRHLSWWKVLTEAITQHRHRGVCGPRASVDSRRVDRLPGSRSLRCRRLQGHGREVGQRQERCASRDASPFGRWRP